MAWSGCEVSIRVTRTRTEASLKLAPELCRSGRAIHHREPHHRIVHLTSADLPDSQHQVLVQDGGPWCLVLEPRSVELLQRAVSPSDGSCVDAMRYYEGIDWTKDLATAIAGCSDVTSMSNTKFLQRWLFRPVEPLCEDATSATSLKTCPFWRTLRNLKVQTD